MGIFNGLSNKNGSPVRNDRKKKIYIWENAYFFYRNFMMSPQQKIKVTVSKLSVIKWWTTLPKNQCSSHARVICCLCLNCAVRCRTENQDDFLLSVKKSVLGSSKRAPWHWGSWQPASGIGVYNGNEGDWWTEEWFTFCSIFNSKPCGVCPWAAVTSLICSATWKQVISSTLVRQTRGEVYKQIPFLSPHPSFMTVIMRIVHLVNSLVTTTS